MNSPQYDAAYTAHNAALAAFHAVRDAYRARAVGDAEFLAAKATLTAANALYDAAFDAEVAA